MQMKRMLTILLSTLMILSAAACACVKQTQSPTQAPTAASAAGAVMVQSTAETESPAAEVQPEPSARNRILILYFSANNSVDADAVSSATPMVDGVSSVEWMANVIHNTVGGDLVPIIPSTDYPLEYNDLADYAKQEADHEERPAFEPLGVDPTAYDVVFLSYPIWWYRLPMILETLFDAYDFSGVTIVPFNTHAGSRDGGTYRMIRDREPNAAVPDGIALSGRDIGTDGAKQQIQAWLSGLDVN